MRRLSLSVPFLIVAVGYSGLASSQVGCQGREGEKASHSVVPVVAIPAALPRPRAYHAVASLDDEMFLVGGSSQRTSIATVDVFNVRSRTWRTARDLPTPRDFLGVAVAGRSIYAVGGLSSNERQLATVEALDVDRNTWRTLPDLAAPRSRLAVVAVGERIFAISGMAQPDRTHFQNLPIVEEFDREANQWRRRADIPTPRHGHAAVVLEDKIYVIGGYGQTPSGNLRKLSSVEMFDPQSNQWTPVASLPVARGFLGAAAVDGRIYTLGGRLKDMPIERYDPRENEWVTLSTWGMSRQRFGIAAFEKTIYVFGGERASDALSVFDTATGTWSFRPR